MKAYYEEENEQKRQMELDLVTEMWEKATTRLWAYKRRMCQAYNKR